MDALDKRTFEMWVREITTRLDRQDKLIAMLARKEYEKDNSVVMEIPLVDGERLLDNQDLCMLLQFSKPIFRQKVGKDLTDDEMKELITNGKTGVLKGFKSKQGKKFSAIVAFDSDFNTQFIFPK